MPSLKHLRHRLRTVKNTKLITRAMRSVSASKMRRAQERRNRAKPYSDRLQELVARLVESTGIEDQPMTQRREVKKRLVTVFSSDRGLCGAFNAVVLRYAEEFLESLPAGETELYLIGRRANDFFRKRRWKIARAHTDFKGNVDVPRVLGIGREFSRAFLDGSYDEIRLIYNHAITAMVYRPKTELFLPLDPVELKARLGKTQKTSRAIDYIYEPNAAELLSLVLPKYVENRILFAFVDALMAEHQARMLAMSTANENCEELLGLLTLQLNKARQAAITKEILEIVSGAEALKG